MQDKKKDTGSLNFDPNLYKSVTHINPDPTTAPPVIDSNKSSGSGDTDNNAS